MKPCIVCAFEFDHDTLGPKGCPNCHGRGLEPGIPRWSRQGRGLGAGPAVRREGMTYRGVALPGESARDAITRLERHEAMAADMAETYAVRDNAVDAWTDMLAYGTGVWRATYGTPLTADLADDMAALDRLQKAREAAAVDDSSRARAFYADNAERQADQAWVEELRARNLQATNLVKLKRAEVCEERLTAAVMGVMLVVLGLSALWAVLR